MKSAIILHGWPSKEEYYNPAVPSLSNAHWLPWLQGQLLKADIAAQTPEVPRSYELNWKIWQREFERFDLSSDTILVGHSAGGGFLVKYLSINPAIKVGKVMLVAPWLDPDGKDENGFFADFEIAPGLAARTAGVTIFGSDNDQASVKRSIDSLRSKAQNLTYREFHNYGHFCFEDMKTVEFPELAHEALA
jgi:predicted alpha/beta hydrolase family esterase